jgi:hypothetical protein
MGSDSVCLLGGWFVEAAGSGILVNPGPRGMNG